MKLVGKLLVFSWLVILVPAVYAQNSTGIISGSVQDESGAMVPAASVTITNADTGITRNTTTDAGGRYHVPALTPGRYDVQAQATGFQTTLRKGIQLTVGAELDINLTLQVGQLQQTAVVEASAPLVETTSSSLTGLVDDKAMRDLPLNGRSFEMLIALQSSAPQIRARGGTPFSGAGAAFTVNGAREVSNLFYMDGTEIVGAGAQSSQPGGILGKNMGVEAVQEFTVLSGNYSAAYGKRAGGIINTATKSGTNDLHGTLFEFLRNDNLDAANFFDNAAQLDRPEFRRNQFGGSVGGPLRKDHSFFFGTYEGLRDTQGKTLYTIVPTEASRALAVPVIRPYLALFPLPTPNGRVFSGGTAESVSSPARISKQDFFLVRVDHRISDKGSIFARYNFSAATQDDPDDNPTFFSYNESKDQILTIEEKRAYATFLNQIRFGFTRGRSYSDSRTNANLDPALLFLPGAPTVGQIGFSSSNTGGSVTTAGSGTSADRYFVVNQFDTGDQIYLYRGAHSLQIGGKFQRIQYNNDFGNSRRGVFQFANLTNFLNATATLFRAPGGNGSGDATKAYRQNYFAAYVQDDWQARRGLTLNLGIRYEVLSVPVEISGGRVSNFRFKWVDGQRVVDSFPTVGEATPLCPQCPVGDFFQGNHNIFAPRVGFAWDPRNDGKTSIRAGFGMFYDQIVEEFRFFTANNVPFFGLAEVSSPPFPFGFANSTGAFRTPQADGVDYNLQVPTRLQYNFSVQRQIAANTSVSAGYVGSHSYHLTRQGDANGKAYTIVNGLKFYGAGSVRKNPAVAGSRIITSDSSAFYQALQLDLIQRLSKGLRGKISYTWAKNMDEASALTSQQATAGPNAPQDPDNPRGDRGLSAFDIRHNMAANFTYDLPMGNNLSGLARTALGGWQVSGILSLSTGSPINANSAINQSRDLQRTIADRPNLVPGASTNPVHGVTAGCGIGADAIPAGQKLQTPEFWFDPCAFTAPPAGFYGNVGRNTIIGPAFQSFDLSLVKNTKIGERWRADFRAEFFNLFNHTNFNLPSHDLFQSAGADGTPVYIGSAGRISATSSTARQVQFGLKLIF